MAERRKGPLGTTSERKKERKKEIWRRTKQSAINSGKRIRSVIVGLSGTGYNATLQVCLGDVFQDRTSNDDGDGRAGPVPNKGAGMD